MLGAFFTGQSMFGGKPLGVPFTYGSEPKEELNGWDELCNTLLKVAEAKSRLKVMKAKLSEGKFDRRCAYILKKTEERDDFARLPPQIVAKILRGYSEECQPIIGECEVRGALVSLITTYSTRST